MDNFERFEDALKTRAQQSSFFEKNENDYIAGYMLSMIKTLADTNTDVQIYIDHHIKYLERIILEEPSKVKEDVLLAD